VRSLEASNAYFLVGVYYWEQELDNKSLACFLKALALREYNLGLEHRACAEALFNVGLLYKRLGFHSKAVIEL